MCREDLAADEEEVNRSVSGCLLAGCGPQAGIQITAVMPEQNSLRQNLVI